MHYTIFVLTPEYPPGPHYHILTQHTPSISLASCQIVLTCSQAVPRGIQDPMEQHNEGLEQPAQQPTLCVTGCGFFANYGSGGMCSKCFRENQQSEVNQQRTPEVKPMQPAAAATPAVVQPPAAVSEPVAAVPASSASPEAEAAAPAEPKVSTRCQKCRKKVGLTGFKCKCGLLFCGQHRYAEAHDCGFDYKTSQREKLAAANPVVQAAKIERI